jgi:transposase
MKRKGKETRSAVGASEGARRATAEAPTAPGAIRPGSGGRFSVGRKVAVIRRLWRGEDLDALSRELGVTAATLRSWEKEFVAGGEVSLKSRQAAVVEEETRPLKAMIGELTMRNELLRERCRALEEGRPLGLRRSRA